MWWAAAATAIQAFSTLQDSQAQQEEARRNKQIALENADLERKRTVIEEQRQRALSAKTIGGIRANYGASGIAMEGSALAVLENSIANAELDAQLIKMGGLARERGYLNNASLEQGRRVNAER